MRVDPLDPASHYKPLWLVYGHESFPTLICCRLNDRDGKTTIWGYSVYKRKAAFRTLGRELVAWMADQERAYGTSMFEFYSEHAAAMGRITKLTTPSPKAL